MVAAEYYDSIPDDFIEFKSMSPAKRPAAGSNTDAYLQGIEMGEFSAAFGTCFRSRVVSCLPRVGVDSTPVTN